MLIKIEGIEPQFKVYKMSENIEGKIYIGKTKCPLKERMKGHRYGKMPCDQHFSNVGWNNVTVEIIDTANSDAELLVRENKTISEYYQNNKVNLLNKNKIFCFGIKKIDLNCDEYYLHRIEIFDHLFFCQKKFDYVYGDSIFKFIEKNKYIIKNVIGAREYVCDCVKKFMKNKLTERRAIVTIIIFLKNKQWRGKMSNVKKLK